MCFKKLFKKSSPVEDKVRYFTTESTGSGHPDLLADAIADAIKDYYLQHDPKSRVAVEAIVTTQYVLLAGEVTSTVEHLPFITIVKDVMRRKGYTKLNKGFDVKNVRIYSKLHTQSPDIAQGTNDEVNGCFPAGTNVLTNLGWRRIETIKENDMVMTDDGTYHKVLQLINNGKKDFINLSTDKGHEVVITRNHQIRGEEYQWIEAGNLDIDSIVNSYCANSFKQKDSMLWYLRGWLLGDGCFGKYPQTLECYLMAYASEVDHLRECISKLPEFDWHEYYSEVDNCYYFYLYSNDVVKFLGNYFYYDEYRAKNVVLENIPSEYYAELLRGLFDTDGYVRVNHAHSDSLQIEFDSKSTLAVRNYQLMLQSLGIASRIKTRTRHDKRGFDFLSNTLCVYSNKSRQNFIEFVGFQLNRKKKIQDCFIFGDRSIDFYIDSPFSYREKINDIDSASTGIGYDLLVEDNHSYIANGLVVHNSGDQGIIFGYACDETVQYIPTSWAMARAITDRITRYSKELPEVFCPDCKSQVTLKYKGDSIVGVDTIVVAASHEPNMEDRVKEIILEDIIPSVLTEFGWSRNDVGRIFINGTGKFEVYGPNGDTGLTGRKLIVNQYGGHSAIGGGSMQGKDNTKVDISAALMARYLAKNVVAANLAERCQVELAYCIGRPNPVSINVECFGTEKVSTEKLERYFKSIDCSPKGIVSRFDLNMVNGRKFYYEDCSSNGWFGRSDVELPWEEVNLQLDKVDWTKY